MRVNSRSSHPCLLRADDAELAPGTQDTPCKCTQRRRNWNDS